jgi:hypothetical protein
MVALAEAADGACPSAAGAGRRSPTSRPAALLVLVHVYLLLVASGLAVCTWLGLTTAWICSGSCSPSVPSGSGDAGGRNRVHLFSAEPSAVAEQRRHQRIASGGPAIAGVLVGDRTVVSSFLSTRCRISASLPSS